MTDGTPENAAVRTSSVPVKGVEMSKIHIGIDIGGTKLIVASAHEDGTILKRERAPTPLDFTEGMNRLDRMIATVAEGRPIAGIGAGAGGGAARLEDRHGFAAASTRMARRSPEENHGGKMGLPFPRGR